MSLKIVSISDTHGMHQKLDGQIPFGDVLVHAGDLTRHGKLHELESFCAWFAAQPHTYKVFIAGNHDACLEQSPELCRPIIEKYGLTYLQDGAVTIDGKVFYGSPRTPQFFDWSFMSLRGKSIRRYWDNIPNKVDVLITHGPPHGIGDLVPPYRGVSRFPRHAGCLQLLLKIVEVEPTLHICGHIHAGHGIVRTDEIPMTTFINAATCTEKYEPTNKPILVELA